MKRLDNISKQNNFKYPKGYFDNLDKEVKDKISLRSECAQNNKNYVFQVFKPYIYMAACILLLVAVMKTFMGIFVEPKSPEVTISVFDENEYMENIFAIISDDQLIIYEFFENIYNNENSVIDSGVIEDYLLQYSVEAELFYK